MTHSFLAQQLATLSVHLHVLLRMLLITQENDIHGGGWGRVGRKQQEGQHLCMCGGGDPCCIMERVVLLVLLVVVVCWALSNKANDCSPVLVLGQSVRVLHANS